MDVAISIRDLGRLSTLTIINIISIEEPFSLYCVPEGWAVGSHTFLLFVASD